jgi:hypothetical protein
MSSFGRILVTFLLAIVAFGTLASAAPVDIVQDLQARGSQSGSPPPSPKPKGSPSSSKPASQPPSRPTSPLPNTCPSAEWIANYLKQKHPGWNGENTVFYSKPATAQSAGVLAGTKQGKYYGSLVTLDMILDFTDKCGPGTQQDLIVPRVSKAIALLSSGTAYVILDPNQPPAATSIWMVDEFPTLKSNNKIKKVIEHHYSSGAEKVIHQK